ncbi:Kinetochore protein spc25-like protein [Thalictrum thalictroides]|uniref:Kinetochore protein SPC25 n=1 Tax=Thalictrum thalictroides TaxID=46969 RepID=A0A7J6VJD8_THATH|nr:Kinetochore protein spc25-like protein [Thalictrum thalictroides]
MEAIQKKMEELRMICEREIPIKQQKANNAAIAFRNSLESIKLTAQQTNQDQVKLGQLKTQLRELEGDLVKALAVKTSKEAKHIMVSDSISIAKARTEDLKKSLHDLKTRKDEYAAIMSQHLLGLATLEEKANQGIKEKEEIQEVISWYNRVLGLRIEAGRGIKFIFKNISVKDPNEEYSFTVRFARETYSLMNCDPHLDGTKELIQELNKTNGFSEFVRTMREKFQAAASNGFRPQSTSTEPDSYTSTQPDSYTVSVCAPASSLSFGEQGKHGNDNVFDVLAEEVDRTPEKVNRGKKGRSPGSGSTKATPPIRRDSRMKISCKEVSPGSASSVRRSARLKAKTSGK